MKYTLWKVTRASCRPKVPEGIGALGSDSFIVPRQRKRWSCLNRFFLFTFPLLCCRIKDNESSVSRHRIVGTLVDAPEGCAIILPHLVIMFARNANIVKDFNVMR